MLKIRFINFYANTILRFMPIYRFIGIWRCPFRRECGPDSEYGADYEFELPEAERVCFTRRHLGCREYQTRKLRQKERTKQEKTESAAPVLLQLHDMKPPEWKNTKPRPADYNADDIF